ncbi:CACTA en-spm transposon protein [Cucumis melo var. makuwa]|uniref:CACTA en-spm transposon protein n=1 Tax=Cucumis melo var. makuwa TaxID=1194695 RepID=A0A5D3E4H2_CUCMM|nr:CACTA en-spm transposon protein [Cucumis melo var. makuwa]
METDDMFLQFEDDLDNIAGGSSSVGDNTGSSSQQTTPTPRRRAQSRLLDQAIGVCVRKTFPVRCLKWADVGREYIEVVKGDLQRLFVLDFNDKTMNRFVEHQMLTTFKEFRVDCHRHFKKYSDPEEARANPPNALVGRDEDWHFLCDHYISRAFQEQSLTNKAARQKQPYNHSSGSKSFLQRQYELAERKGQPVDRVELFRETHVRAGTFVSLPQRVVSHSLRMRYAIRCWVDDQATQKALVGDPSRRPAEWQVQAIRRYLVRNPQKKRLNYKLNFMKLWNRLKYKIESSSISFTSGSYEKDNRRTNSCTTGTTT